MATIDIDIDDYLDEASTSSLIEELEGRARRDPNAKQALAAYRSSTDQLAADWRLLVDLIAARDCDEALHLIRKMVPETISHGELIMAQRRAYQLSLSH